MGVSFLAFSFSSKVSRRIRRGYLLDIGTRDRVGNTSLGESRIQKMGSHLEMIDMETKSCQDHDIHRPLGIKRT